MNLPMDLGFESHPHDTRRIARRDGKDTEVAAAARVQLRMSETRQAVLDAVHELGGAATAEQAERLPQFAGFAPSSVRKRLGELAEMGYLVEDGTRLNSRGLPMTLYRVAASAAENPDAVHPDRPAVARASESRTGIALAGTRAGQIDAAEATTRRGPYEVGERVRIRATRQLAEVYEVANRHEAPHAQRVRCGWSIGGTSNSAPLAGCDEWFDGDEQERLP